MSDSIVVHRHGAQNNVEVTTYQDLVVLHLSHAQEYLPFDGQGAVHTGTKLLCYAAQVDKRAAQMAIDAAMLVMDHVYEVRSDIKPAGGAVKHELIERHRRTLTRRLEIMLNSLREDKRKSNAVLAKELVEVCLKEVFA